MFSSRLVIHDFHLNVSNSVHLFFVSSLFLFKNRLSLSHSHLWFIKKVKYFFPPHLSKYCERNASLLLHPLWVILSPFSFLFSLPLSLYQLPQLQGLHFLVYVYTFYRPFINSFIHLSCFLLLVLMLSLISLRLSEAEASMIAAHVSLATQENTAKVDDIFLSWMIRSPSVETGDCTRHTLVWLDLHWKRKLTWMRATSTELMSEWTHETMKWREKKIIALTGRQI